jgi:hypothetical protein
LPKSNLKSTSEKSLAPSSRAGGTKYAPLYQRALFAAWL